MTPWRGTWAAGTATVLLAALAVGGCGGGSGGADGPLATVESAPQTTTPSPAPSKTHSPERAAKKPPAAKAPSKRPSLSEAGRLQAARIPVAKRAAVATRTAAIVFRVFGFRSPALEVGTGGASIQATVGARDACSSTSRTEGRIADRLRQTLPFVRTVQILVSGTGQTLGAYAKAHCAGLQLPGGTAKVVFTQKGSGSATTKSFTVRSKRWTVEYINDGSFLQVMPMKGDLPTAGSFAAQSRGAGKHMVQGAGTFRLRIGAVGDWVVRVRDGK